MSTEPERAAGGATRPGASSTTWRTSGPPPRSEGRLRELLAGHPNNWARTEAAHALWRITGDASAAVAALAETVQPLASPDGSFLPVRRGAMRYLAAIPDPSPGGPAAALASGAARAVLASPRRLGYDGGWRAFAEDDEIRAAAADYLAAA